MVPLQEDFVDRAAELQTFWEMVRPQSDQRLLLIQGLRGMGKTYLLNEYRAQSEAAGLAHAWVDFDDSANRDHVPIVALRIWRQLQLGSFQEFLQIMADYRTSSRRRVAEAVGAGRVSGAEAPSPAGRGNGHSPQAPDTASDDGSAGDRIVAELGNVGAGAQVAVGKEIEMVSQFIVNFQRDDPFVRQAVQDSLTTALAQRLSDRAQTGTTLFFFPHWDKTKTATGEWLRRELLGWILDGTLPNAVAVIAGLDVPDLGRLPHRIRWLTLQELPDEAVRTYWVEKCGLPAADVPIVTEISGGIPLAMYAAAEQYFQAGQVGLAEMAAGAPEPDRSTRIGRSVEGLLSAVPPSVAQALRLGAIPHWFDRALLAQLCGPELDLEQAIAYLARLRFVYQDAQGRFRYNDAVREHLNAWWRRERSGPYAAANRRALQYFQALAAAASRHEQPVHEREVLYHLLAEDEPAGLDYLQDRFEHAWGQYALEQAEGLVEQVVERRDTLSSVGQQWRRYFEARLDLHHGRKDAGKATFADLRTGGLDPRLQALACWSLGEIRVTQHRWSQAICLYNDSLKVLRGSAPMYAARVMLSLADVYCDLAESSGGFQAQESEVVGRATQILHILQHLPFLAYEWLVHRFRFLPSWYFGTNYQDWIITYLLREAANWCRRAEKVLKEAGDLHTLVQAQLSLADLEHQLGRWAQARWRYTSLLEMDEVRSSDYRRARVRLGEGRALWAEGDPSAAEPALAEALATFRRFDDHRSAGAAALLAGHAYAALGRSDEAATAYVESVQCALAVADPLSSTQAVGALEDLARQAMLSAQRREAIEATVAQVEERHYIARFPDHLLRWFRGVALWAALPLTYVLMFAVALAFTWALQIIEGEFLFLWTGATAPAAVRDALILTAFVVLPVPVALWLYRLIYTLAGIAVVGALGHRLVSIEREQPSYFVIRATGLTRHDVSTDARQTLGWTEMSSFASVDYLLRRRSIDLISSTVVVAGTRPVIVVEAITAGYEHLKREIARALGTEKAASLRQDLDFVVFANRWLLIAVSLVLAFTLFMLGRGFGRTYGIEYAKQSGQEAVLLLTSMTYLFTFTALLVFPTLTLWRLIWHRRRVRRTLGYAVQITPSWLLWLAALLGTALTGMWLMAVALSAPV